MINIRINTKRLNNNALDINIDLIAKKANVDEMILKNKIEKEIIGAITTEIKKSSYKDYINKIQEDINN